MKNSTSGHVEVNLLGINIHAIHSPWRQTIAIDAAKTDPEEASATGFGQNPHGYRLLAYPRMGRLLATHTMTPKGYFPSGKPVRYTKKRPPMDSTNTSGEPLTVRLREEKPKLADAIGFIQFQVEQKD